MLKKIYTLPAYVLDELREKGLLHLLNADADATAAPQAVCGGCACRGVPDVMRPMVEGYDVWAAKQDAGGIVPVRYHPNVFSSAGSGYVFDESLETEALWFRASFF